MLKSELQIVKPSRYIALVWTLCVALINSCASDPQSSRADVKKLDAICGRLIGSMLGDAAWQELDPYITRPAALQHLEGNCDDSCKGSLALQSGYFIDYWYISRNRWINLPRAQLNTVYGVVLRRGDKTIQSYAVANWEGKRY